MRDFTGSIRWAGNVSQAALPSGGLGAGTRSVAPLLRDLGVSHL